MKIITVKLSKVERLLEPNQIELIANRTRTDASFLIIFVVFFLYKARFGVIEPNIKMNLI
jgi:hypothetical protein